MTTYIRRENYGTVDDPVWVIEKIVTGYGERQSQWETWCGGISKRPHDLVRKVDNVCPVCDSENK